MSGVAHFFVVVGGSKIHERLAHFFVDIYTLDANGEASREIASYTIPYFETSDF